MVFKGGVSADSESTANLYWAQLFPVKKSKEELLVLNPHFLLECSELETTSLWSHVTADTATRSRCADKHIDSECCCDLTGCRNNAVGPPTAHRMQIHRK